MYTEVLLNTKEDIQRVIDFNALKYPSSYKTSYQPYHNLIGIQHIISSYELCVDEDGDLCYNVTDEASQYNDTFELPKDFFETVYFQFNKDFIESSFHKLQIDNSPFNKSQLYTYKGKFGKPHDIVYICENDKDFPDFVKWDNLNSQLLQLDNSHPIFEFIKKWLLEIKKEFFNIVSKATSHSKERLIYCFGDLKKLADYCDIEIPNFTQSFDDTRAINVINNLNDEFKNYINLSTTIKYDQFERHTKLEKLLVESGAIIETTDSYFTIVGYEIGSKFFKALKNK